MGGSSGSLIGGGAGAAIGGLVGGPVGAIAGGMIGGGLGGTLTNKKPSVPGLTGQEQALLQKQGITLDQMNEILSQESTQLSQNRDLLRQFSGLYNEDGTINQAAVADLRNRTMEQQALSEGVSADALNYLKGVFQPTDYQTQSSQIAKQELDRYQKALSGDVPITEAQRQQEQLAFEKLKESAGQRGIMIEGNDIFTATSQSTAGNQLLSNLRSDALKNRQNIVESELNRGLGANTARLGLGLQESSQLSNLAGSLVQTPGASQLGFLQNSFSQTPASLFPGYSNLSSGYQTATQPYQSQRYLNFNNSLAQYGAKNQMFSDIMNLGGMLGMGALARK